MAAPNAHVKVAGTWKPINKVYVRVGGSWKLVNKAYVRVAGTWKLISQGVTPGSISYTTPGTYSFTVPNHNSLQVELWGAGGGGCAFFAPGTAGSPAKWDGGSASGKPQANGGASNAPGNGANNAGGTAVNGDVNTSGGVGLGLITTVSSNGLPNPWAGTRRGGSSPNGGLGGLSTNALPGGHGEAPGGGGCGVYSVNEYWNDDGPTGETGYTVSESGGAGAYCKKTYGSGVYAVGASVQVVVPPDALGGLNGDRGGTGARGQAIITWS